MHKNTIKYYLHHARIQVRELIPNLFNNLIKDYFMSSSFRISKILELETIEICDCFDIPVGVYEDIVYLRDLASGDIWSIGDYVLTDRQYNHQAKKQGICTR